MQAIGAVRAALLLGALGAASCAPMAEINAKLDEIRAKQAEDDSRRRDEITALRQEHEAQLRDLYSRMDCTNVRVRDFIKECEDGSNVCSEEGLANALLFMDTQPYVLMFLRPKTGMDEIVETRVGQLMSLTESKFWKPSTKFLILAQPHDDTAIGQAMAIKAGEQMMVYLRTNMGIASKFRILGPKTLQCKVKADKVAHYTRKYDRPVKGEPVPPEPVVRVWVFRTNC